MSNRVFSRLFPAFLLIIIMAVIPAAWYSSNIIKDLYFERSTHELEGVVKMIQNIYGVRGEINEVDFSKINQATDMRLTFIDMGGKVVFDSDKDVTKMDNHADREEVKKALTGLSSSQVRYSNTLKTDMLYFAAPLKSSTKIVGVIRVALPMNNLEERVSSIYWQIAVFGIIIAVLCATLSTVISRRFSLPWEKLYRGANRFAEGKFDKKLNIKSAHEVAGVAEAVNKMGEQLQLSHSEIYQQNRESSAILSSLREGVLAVTQHLEVIRLNKSASLLLGISKKVKGQKLENVLRNPAIINFITEVLDKKSFLEKDCIIYTTTETLLHLKGTPLVSEDGTISGAVVVLNDVTRVRQLENMRRDFVANVTHELKTPISVIQGAVETLENGAIDDRNDAAYFLKMLAKNGSRLSNLIDDILQLSIVENNEASEQMEHIYIDELLTDALVELADAKEKEVKLSFKIDNNLTWSVYPSLLQQAVTNLVENAIKYSGPSVSIEITTEVANNQLVLSVTDNGFGIDKVEQKRVFERFYRIDRSRSTKIEGTGLGLAIVKHIARVHHGSVELKSKLGQGSTFSISIPAKS